MNYESEIGERLASLRKSRNLTQNGLANLLFIQRGQIAKWEAGESVPKVEYVIKYADFFNTTCDYILRGISPENCTVMQEIGLSEESINYLKSKMKTYPLPIRYIDYFLSDHFKADTIFQQFQRIIELQSDAAFHNDIDDPSVVFSDGSSIYQSEIITALKIIANDGIYRISEEFFECEVKNAKKSNP